MQEKYMDFENYKSRGFLLAFIIDHFGRQGIEPGTLLHGTGLTKKVVDNPYNWITILKLNKILQNCYRCIPNLTLYDWQEILMQLRCGAVGNFFRSVTSLVGTHTMYMMAPHYAQQRCNYQYLKLLYIKNGKADFVTGLEPELIPFTNGCSFQLTAGMLAAIPTYDGALPACAKVLFDQSILKNIVKKMYRRYGFSYRQKGDAVYIGNKPVGRKIRLEEDIINKKRVFSVNYTLKAPFNAILIEDELRYGKTVLLQYGDIFNAPYGRIRVTWDDNYPKEGLLQNYKQNNIFAKETFLFLEKQIKQAEERYFESERFREKERKISKKFKMANRVLKEEIAERKRTEMLLKAREKEMALQTSNMQEANTALKVLLKKREEDKKKFSEKVLFNIKELILPYLEKLKETDLKATQRAYVEILESNFEELSSPLALKLSFKYYKLTSAEVRVAMLIRQGRTTQQIAELLNLSPRTIDAYRANIRRKLKIKNKKINLCTYLNSI